MFCVVQWECFGPVYLRDQVMSVVAPDRLAKERADRAAKAQREYNELMQKMTHEISHPAPTKPAKHK